MIVQPGVTVTLETWERIHAMRTEIEYLKKQLGNPDVLKVKNLHSSAARSGYCGECGGVMPCNTLRALGVKE